MDSLDTQVHRSATGGFFIQCGTRTYSYGPFHSALVRDALLLAAEDFASVAMTVAALSELSDFEGLNAEIAPQFKNNWWHGLSWSKLLRVVSYYLAVDAMMAEKRLTTGTFLILVQISQELKGGPLCQAKTWQVGEGRFNVLQVPTSLERFTDTELLMEWLPTQYEIDPAEYATEFIRIY